MYNNRWIAICIIVTGFLSACSNGGERKEAIDAAVLNSILESSNNTSAAVGAVSSDLLFSNEIVNDVISMASDGDCLYLATAYEMDEYDTKQGARRSLAGHQYVQIDPPDWDSNVYYPARMVKSGEYVYYINNASTTYPIIQKLFTGKDNKSAPESIVNKTDIHYSDLGAACDEYNIFWTEVAGDSWDVYKKELNNHSLPAKILTISASPGLEACKNYLYIKSGIGHYTQGTPCLQKYDVLNGTLTTVQSGIVRNYFADIAVCCTAKYAYWANGDSIYRSRHATGSVEHIVSGVGEVIQLEANDSALYARQGYPDPHLCRIIKVDPVNKNYQVLYSSRGVESILLHMGTLYFTAEHDIYKLECGGSAINLTPDDEMVFSSLECAVKNKIIVKNNYGTRYYFDIRDNTRDLFSIEDTAAALANSNDLFAVCDLDRGIVKIPYDMEMRQPKTVVSGSFMEGMGFVINDDRIYWVDRNNYSKPSRISCIKKDGSDRRTIFEVYDEEDIRGFVIYNGRLYLPYSYDNGSSWYLVSMNLDGEDFAAHYILGYDPASLQEKNGILYLVDTIDASKIDYSILALNLAENDHSLLISGLARDETDCMSEGYHSFYVSNNYVYFRVPLYIWPIDRPICRSKRVNWAAVGDTEVIVDSTIVHYNLFFAHDNYFYFANPDGLRRIRE